MSTADAELDPAGTELDLEKIATSIEAPAFEAADQARVRLDEAGMLGGLGQVGTLAVWWAGVRDDTRAAPPSQVVLVGAAPGVGAGPDPQVRRIALEPPGDIDAAVAWGVATADAIADTGSDLLLLSVPDAFAARLVAAQLMGLDAVEASGWPQARSMDDDTWMDEVTRTRDGLVRLRGLRGRPLDLLRALASPTFAAATALLVQGAVRRTPAILDGPAAAAAALLARRTSIDIRDWWQVGHGGVDPLHERTLASLRLDPLSRLGLSVEDGTGALLGLAVLDLAARYLGSSEPVDDVPLPSDDPAG